MKWTIGMLPRLKINTGFSLIELMVALAIGAVIMAVALPSFGTFMANSRMAATNNALVYSIQVARSTSMERLTPTGVCVSTAPTANEPSCAIGESYNQGWIVYADDNANGSRDNGEDILDRIEPPGPAFAFTPSTVFANQIYFSEEGASINVAGVPVSGTINVDYGDGQQVRLITVSANGRVSTETP